MFTLQIVVNKKLLYNLLQHIQNNYSSFPFLHFIKTSLNVVDVERSGGGGVVDEERSVVLPLHA